MAQLGEQKRFLFDFAQPPDITRGEFHPNLRIIHLEDLLQEAKQNTELRSQAMEQAEDLIECALRDFYQQNKEAPVLRDFSAVEPQFREELEMALSQLEKYFPKESLSRVKEWAWKLTKKNLHHSREHLRSVLRSVSNPSPPTDAAL